MPETLFTSLNLNLWLLPAPNSLDDTVKLLDLTSNSTSAQIKSSSKPRGKIPSVGNSSSTLHSGSSKTMRRSRILRNPIAFVCCVVFICCLLILSISILRLPEIPFGVYPAAKTIKQASNNGGFFIGKFGEMMIEMLPEDLAFTLFLPSEKAFERDLRLRPNDSFAGEKMNDTYAVISRVLGFSAVPRSLTSVNVAIGKELSYDSISGFALYISKDEDGMLVVNGVRSARVDLRKKASVVHIMDGVVMDAEFEQSVQADDE